MPVRVGQAAFAGGEIAPALTGRTDLDKYSASLATAKNVVISKYGSVLNRPGTLFVGEVRDSSKATRLIPFQFGVTQTYAGEIGDEVWRPIMDGGQILRTATNITACTAASPGVFTSTSHGASVGERVYITGVTGLELSSVSQVNGRVFIVATVPTANTFTLTDLYGTSISTASLTAYSSGGTVARLYQLTFPYDSTEVFDIGYAQTADTMYLTHMGYAPRKLTRSGHATWTINSVTFGPVQASPTSPTATATVGSGATTYGYKITAVDEDTGEESLPTSAATCTNDLTVSGNYNTVGWTGASGAQRYIVYKDDNGVYGLIGGTTGTSFIDNNILPDLGDAPPGSRNPFGSTSNYPAVCEFHEGRLCYAQTINTPAGVWLSVSNRYDNFNVAVPAKADDAVSFELRPGVNAVQGLLSLKKLSIFTTDREWTVEGGGVTQFITPSSLVTTPHTARGSRRLKPIAVGDIGLYVQRQGAVIRAFGYSFEKDGFRSNDLTLLAPHLFRGFTIVDWCYQQDPDSIVWCVRSDGVLLALTFVEDQNTFAWTRCYVGGTFGSGASATGYGVVESCCCIEGDSQDDVYLVVKRTINSVTKRYIERIAPRWVPTFNSSNSITNVDDCYFVDAGVTYSGSLTSVVPNLHHLEGQSVSALVDGNVQGPFTVSNGQITLSTAKSASGPAHVGLTYTADIIDLPITQDTQSGASQGRQKTVNALVLKLNATRGIKYGLASQPSLIKELKTRDVEDWDDPIQPFSGDTNPLSVDGGGDIYGAVLIRQSQPLPMEILGFYKDVTFGGP